MAKHTQTIRQQIVWACLTILVLNGLKVFHSKQNPKIVRYRDYKNFNNEQFKWNLSQEILFQT